MRFPVMVSLKFVGMRKVPYWKAVYLMAGLNFVHYQARQTFEGCLMSLEAACMKEASKHQKNRRQSFQKCPWQKMLGVRLLQVCQLYYALHRSWKMPVLHPSLLKLRSSHLPFPLPSLFQQCRPQLQQSRL